MKSQFHVIEQLDAYLHELISATEADYVEEHCRRCSICESALAEARKRRAILDAVPACEASEQLVQQTLDAIRNRDHVRRRSRKYVFRAVFAAVAAAVLVLGGLHLYYLNLAPSPYELTILGQNQLLAATNGSLRICLRDRVTGHALAGVPVRVEMRDKQRSVDVASFRTDEQGTGQPRLQLPDWDDGDYQLRVVATTSWTNTEELTQTVKLRRSWKLMLTSDKPVYQPGQQIRIRSLTLRQPDLKPVAARAVTFTVLDPVGNVIFKRNDVTTMHGIAFVDCPLANEIAEGPYAVVCRIGDTESKLRVEVKKYVLPKFKIELTLDQPFYQPGQRVSGKLQAKYFYGKPVAKAEVALHVENLTGGGAVVPEIKITTDTDGLAPFDFRLPDSLPGQEADGGARIGVLAMLTDVAGQKETRTTTSVVSAEPLRIEAIPESGQLVSGVANRVFLLVTYPDGQPAAKARLTVSGEERQLGTNEFGVAVLELPPPSSPVSLTIRATDVKGQVGRYQTTLECGPARSDFLMRTDKAVYTGGDTVNVSAFGGGVEPVFVDLIKDGQTMLTEAVAMQNGRGDLAFDLPADLFGTVELVAYRQMPAGTMRKARVLYVRPVNQLTIKAQLDQAEYRPGGKAKLQVALTDPKGQPVAGAVSLSAVDEAVFAVLAQRPGMEGTFYHVEQRLLEPIYRIYPWSPDFSAGPNSAERRQLEQALFARTAKNLTGSETDPKEKPHSLTGSSYPAKNLEITEARRTGLGRVHTGWMVFVGLLLAAGLVHGLVVYKPWVTVHNFLESLEEERAERWDRQDTIAGSTASSQTSRHGQPGCNPVSSVFVGALLIIVCLLSIQILGKSANSAFGTVGSSIGATVGGGGAWAPVATRDAPMKSMSPNRDDMAPPPPTESKPEPKADPKPDLKLGPDADKKPEEAPAPPRIRDFFPETLLWKPELITDEQGRASLEVDLADSITTWKLSASAVTTDGRLGAASESIRVFQPFFVDLNLPVALTRNDEVALPVVLTSYLNEAQTVTLDLKTADWFELLPGEKAVRTLELKPGEKVAVRFPIRVRKVAARQLLTVEARGGQMSDAIKRTIEVVPDGRKVERVVNGALVTPADLNLTVPADAIEGSPKLILKVYPSSFSQLVEGLDNIFRMPSGCFEQTSSTTYPNVLALDYLRRTGKSVPAVEAKARQYIQLGYQRLLTFEVNGGGFDWFGRPPANRTLTAYGLMEFQDMAKVSDVDPQLIQRTREWLLSQRNGDGSWQLEGHQMHDDPAARAGNLGGYSTTAYIAWSVFDGRPFDATAAQTRQYLLARNPNTIGDSYVLALACNALLSLDAGTAVPYIQALEVQRKTSANGKLVWWEQSAGGRTAFYGAGVSGNVETTALAAMALIRSGQQPGLVRGALAWLAQQKDANGTWHSTQATVLALKALIAGTGKTFDDGQARQITITLGNDVRRTLTIPAEQSEVMQQIDLSGHLSVGDHRLQVKETTGSGAGYQVAFTYHVPASDRTAKGEPLSIDLAYDRTDLAVNDTVKVTAAVRNRMAQAAPMVMLDLPIPPGFALVPDGLNQLVAAGTIARYQVTARQVLVYLRGLEPDKKLELTYALRATLPVKVTVPPARAYEYYDPAKEGRSAPGRLTVTAQP